MSMKEIIANNIREFRKSKGLTQEELGAIIGVKGNTVTSWERATNSVDIDMLYNICEALGVTIYDILGDKRSEGSYESHPCDFEIRDGKVIKYDGLSLENQRKFEAFYRFLLLEQGNDPDQI